MEGFSNCRPYKKIETILSQLKADNKTQSLLSASDQDSLDKMIVHYNFSDKFDFVYGIDNKMAASKLQRGRELIAQANIAKDKTVLIGDTLHDLEVGSALGVDVILLSHGHQCETILSQRHHKVLNHI